MTHKGSRMKGATQRERGEGEGGGGGGGGGEGGGGGRGGGVGREGGVASYCCDEYFMDGVNFCGRLPTRFVRFHYITSALWWQGLKDDCPMID